jgi:hypothetical protein
MTESDKSDLPQIAPADIARHMLMPVAETLPATQLKVQILQEQVAALIECISVMRCRIERLEHGKRIDN